MPVPVLAALLPVPINVSGKAAEEGLSSLVPATRVGGGQDGMEFLVLDLAWSSPAVAAI